MEHDDHSVAGAEVVEFVGDGGKVLVRAKTDWAIIDKALGRPIRVPPEVIAPFVAAE